MKTGYLLLIIFLALFVSGCFMHTVTGANYYFPPGSNPTNSEYHLWIGSHGATMKAYSDRTQKRVIVQIQKGNKNIFLREYELLAASLEPDVSGKE
jgi:hypothetical protein